MLIWEVQHFLEHFLYIFVWGEKRNLIYIETMLNIRLSRKIERGYIALYKARNEFDGIQRKLLPSLEWTVQASDSGGERRLLEEHSRTWWCGLDQFYLVSFGSRPTFCSNTTYALLTECYDCFSFFFLFIFQNEKRPKSFPRVVQGMNGFLAKNKLNNWSNVTFDILL